MRQHYDAGGRLDSLVWRAGDTLHYTYKTTGDLDTLWVSLTNSAGGQKEHYVFAWDSMGRRQEITYPFLNMTVTSHYDRLGVLREMASVNSGIYMPNRFEFTPTQDSVDAMGRPLHQHMQCRDVFQDTMPADPCGDWLPSDAITRYYRTGAIAVQALTGRNFIITTDSFTYDPSGNRHRFSNRTNLTTTISTYTYPTSPLPSNRVASKLAARMSVKERGPAYRQLIWQKVGHPFHPEAQLLTMISPSHAVAMWAELHANVAIFALYDRPGRPASEAPFLLLQFTMDETLAIMATQLGTGLPAGFADQMRREYGNPGQGRF